MIPEPQLAYVLELLTALGPAAEHFVLAGARAIKFANPTARRTNDFDFVLDVISLRQLDYSLAKVLQSLDYAPDPKARNFQFEKPIPNSAEKMRIEFMAPDEYQRKSDFRVDIADGIHARACVGGSIVLIETDFHEIQGTLPNGEAAQVRLRVTRPAALVMMKCLALDDRYRGLRGPEHYEYDREMAKIHAADVFAVVRARPDAQQLLTGLRKQFKAEPALGRRVFQIIRDYFGGESKPGLLLYEEYLNDRVDPGEGHQEDIRAELLSATRFMAQLISSDRSKTPGV